MELIEQMRGDGELIASYALRHRIVLPEGTIQKLLSAAADNSKISLKGSAQDSFLSTYQIAVEALDQSIADIRSTAVRQARLVQPVADAQLLLRYSAASGKKIEDATRNSIIAVNAAIDDDSVSVAQEQEFLKAYEALSSALSPVTVETLAASRTVLPICSGPDFRNFKRWTLGRFVNVLVFYGVLTVACISLSYYAEGAAGLKRVIELKAGINTGGDGSAAMKKELDVMPDHLFSWAKLPCEDKANPVFEFFLCSKALKQLTEDLSLTKSPDQIPLAQMEAARTVSDRLNNIYLPLLLGWLGAHAFVLRSMSKAITERSFAPGSAFDHIARMGLGALAGLASTWLLTGSAIGGPQWASIPIWALAFVAGYGIELVFSFMDRIISAFEKK